MTSPVVKAGFDTGALAVILGWAGDALPTLALIIPTVYYSFLLWETKTVQGLVNRAIYRRAFSQGVKAGTAATVEKVAEVASPKVVDKVEKALADIKPDIAKDKVP